MQKDENEDSFSVFKENWEAVLVFLSCQTQWRKEITMSGHVLWHGLRYQEAGMVIQMMGFSSRGKSIFKDLQVMEMAALPILNRSTR